MSLSSGYTQTLASVQANGRCEHLGAILAVLAIKIALPGTCKLFIFRRARTMNTDTYPLRNYTANKTRWLDRSNEARNSIKHPCLLTLGSENKRASTIAAQAVSAIAAIQFPHGEWQDLIGNLLINRRHQCWNPDPRRSAYRRNPKADRIPGSVCRGVRVDRH
jgi:importin subunit beta-1